MDKKRFSGLLIFVLISIVSSAASLGEQELPASFVLDDLPLISLASVAAWENSWEYSRAVEAATILAWLTNRGYVALLGDLNEDGGIDESDAVELANRFGSGSMKCGAEQNPTDAWLLIGLASYVAQHDPGGFELAVYDAGFPAEYEQRAGVPFSRDVIPGIVLTVEPEPSVPAYMVELASGAAVIVGLEQEPGRNLYFAGRSFLRDPVRDETYAVDLVCAEEDRFAAGTQGTVLKTEARDTDALYVDYQGTPMKVESMFALRPAYPCLGVASMATRNCSAGPEGKTDCTIMVQVEITKPARVLVESAFEIILVVGGEADAPTLTLAETVEPREINPTGRTVVDFAFPSPAPSSETGFCTYSLRIHGLSNPWDLSAIVCTAIPIPMGDPQDESGNGFFYGEGCCEDTPGCLDIIITAGCPICHCQDVVSEIWHPDPTYPQGGWWESVVVGESCEVKVRCTVENIGTQDAGEFSIRLESSTGSMDTEVLNGLTSGREIHRWFTLPVDQPGTVTVTILADSAYEIDECDEENNLVEVGAHCH